MKILKFYRKSPLCFNHKNKTRTNMKSENQGVYVLETLLAPFSINE